MIFFSKYLVTQEDTVFQFFNMCKIFIKKSQKNTCYLHIM